MIVVAVIDVVVVVMVVVEVVVVVAVVVVAVQTHTQTHVLSLSLSLSFSFSFSHARVQTHTHTRARAPEVHACSSAHPALPARLPHPAADRDHGHISCQLPCPRTLAPCPATGNTCTWRSGLSQSGTTIVTCMVVREVVVVRVRECARVCVGGAMLCHHAAMLHMSAMSPCLPCLPCLPCCHAAMLPCWPCCRVARPCS